MSFHDDHCNHSSTSNANHSCALICNDSYMLKDLSNRIKAIRSNAGDTPNSAAKKIGISRTGYVKWEDGATANMKLDHLLNFCSAYNVDLAKLLVGDQPYSTAGQSSALQAEQPVPRYSDDNLTNIVRSYARLPLARQYKINLAIANALMEEKLANPDFDVGDLGRLIEMKR